MSPPLVVVTLSDPSRSADPELAARRNARYEAAVARHGASPLGLTGSARADERKAALARMGGLLLAGGPDLDPARYGRPAQDARPLDPARDELEAEAWAVAADRDLPVLGICRGLQAINVFSGGRLLQHVEGHAGAEREAGPPATHPLRVVPGTRLARILFPTNLRAGVLQVNSHHHQAVRPADLAPGLVACATASSAAGEIVEALETRIGRFVVGVQSHPERRESTPPNFERLFAFFVDACRGPARAR